ncbi:hypothetical protein SLEP1_g19776 [Rubroshorea leprosula]|uniref:Scarecrow-like protein 14 n=1 Tax=Rubroshorea leprosula TaxID=152421 RepID=A0AAV5J0E8_9ROSI|nr:hypothetical protein SLEP1_g19776 [Rubroshorea leprosula]
MGKEGDSGCPTDGIDLEDSILKYISEELMAEDMENNPSTFHNALALQAAEKSLYEVLGQNYPTRTTDNETQTQITMLYDCYQGAENPESCSSGNFDVQNSFGCSSSSNSSSFLPPWNGDCLENNTNRPSFFETPVPSNFFFQSTSSFRHRPSLSSQNNFSNNGGGAPGYPVSEFVIQQISQLVRTQFNKGVEEANRCLLKVNNQGEYLPTFLTKKKNHVQEDEDLEEGRNNKQSATSMDDETELLVMFDRMLACGGRREPHPSFIVSRSLQNMQSKTTLQPSVQTNYGSSNGGKAARGKKQQGNKKKVIYLRTPIISCAKAFSANDLTTAKGQLKQIKQHCAQFGDGTQRLAHVFVDALEARIAGTGIQIYTALSSNTKSIADVLKAFQLYIAVCPFIKCATIFANHSILKLVEEKKATTLYIIDFGIDFSGRGFRPDKAVQEAGRRLAMYCGRYNVPFEYNAIAQKWETIQIEDLKISPDEAVTVNSQNRFENLLDETVVENNPRDTVLNLIRKINPDMFIHSIVNGSHNAPFFVRRFREALFHYSALFDMFDAIIPRGDQIRLMFEKELWRQEVMNIVACEGTGRIERPETYRQWQFRSKRAGFRQRPLDPELMREFKGRLSHVYHNDFIVEQNGQWMLQGWKGRILFASSVWVPP